MICATGGTFCDEEGNYHCATDEGVRKAFENLKKLNQCEALSQIQEWSADWQAGFANDVLVSQLIGGWMKDHLMNWTPENSGKWGMAMAGGDCDRLRVRRRNLGNPQGRPSCSGSGGFDCKICLRPGGAQRRLRFDR